MLLGVGSQHEVEDLVANFLWTFTEEWAIFLQVDGICVAWSHSFCKR